MVGYGSTALPTRAGPAEHRNILINGNICEIVSVKCDPELANYIENAECSGSGKVFAAPTSAEISGGWRELPMTSSFDDDLPANARPRACALRLYAPDATSGSDAPIFLVPPSEYLDSWTVALGSIGKTRPTELFVIRSSIPFSQAMDELCAMVARLSLSDPDPDPDPSVAPVGTQSSSIEDLLQAIDSLSLGDVPSLEVEEEFPPWDNEPPFCGYIDIVDETDVYDGSSDATCVEDDSIISWITVCEDDTEQKEDLLVNAKDAALQDILECLHTPVLAKWTELSLLSRPSTQLAAPAMIAHVGLQCWKPSKPFSLPSVFAPALRAVSF